MRTLVIRLLCLACIFTCSLTTSAADLIWDSDISFPGPQDGGGNWNELTTNWWNGIANVGWNSATPDNAIFGAGTADFGAIVTVPANTTNTVGNMTFQVLGSGNYNINAASPATSKLNLFANPTIYVTNGLSASIGTVLMGTSFTKAGGGTLTLNPGAPNVNSGPTYVAAGTLVIGAGSANRRVIPGDLVVTNATARLGQSENIASNAAVSLHAGAKLEMNSRSQTLAALLLDDSTVTQAGTESLLVTGGVDARAGAFLQGPAGSGKLDAGSFTKSTAGTVTLTTRGSTAASGGITNTILNAGTLILDYLQDNSKLLDSGSLTVNGGTLLFTNGAHTENVGSVIITGGILTNVSGSVTLQTGAGYDVRAGEIYTVLAGSGRTLAKSTAGKVILGANNTYSGGTLISSGVLQIGIGGASGTSGSSSAAITNNGQLVFNRSDALSLSGVISGTGSVTKLGGGTLAFTAVHTYLGGTTISNGVLSIDGDATLGDGVGALHLAGGGLATTATRSSANPVANPIVLDADSAVTTISSASSVDLNFTSDAITGTAGTLTFRNDGANTNSDQFEPRFSGSFTFARPIVIDNGLVGRTRLSSFNTNGTTQTFDGAISGNGAFRRSFGAGFGGVTVFNADHTYTGDTTINGGTLLVNGSIGSSAVFVSSGGVLGGNGTLHGPVTAQSAGIVSPGTSIGRLTISNSLVLQPGSTTFMELNRAAGTNDQVGGLTSVTYGGTLVVSNLSGVLIGNDTFKLFDAGSYSNSFDALALPPLAGGRTWNTSGLAIDGTIKVIGGGAAPPQIGTVSITPSGIVVTGTGGTAGANYYVLTSTNLALPLSNWTPIATNQFVTGGTFGFTNAIDQATPRLYFIIQTP